MPACVVIHKSSNYTRTYIASFYAAAQDFPRRQLPPAVPRGSVWFYATCPGIYIPEPVELRIVRSEEIPLFYAAEVLGLTEMNWNDTRFDGKYPSRWCAPER